MCIQYWRYITILQNIEYSPLQLLVIRKSLQGGKQTNPMRMLFSGIMSLLCTNMEIDANQLNLGMITHILSSIKRFQSKPSFINLLNREK